jgi:hypothetical protein
LRERDQPVALGRLENVVDGAAGRGRLDHREVAGALEYRDQRQFPAGVRQIGDA